jgi:hypothetical protein
MNDFFELENELKKLRPAQPSENLAARIERSLAEAQESAATAGVLPKSQHFRVNWFSLGLGLTAAAALLLVARIDGDHPVKRAPATASAPAASPSTTTEKTDRLVVSGLTQVVYNTRDEGLLFAADAAQPMRRLRSQTRQTLQWRNPSTGASLRVSYPSEEVELIPVSGQ